ncbi:DUF551 domain-containing protein [Klebsiella pneumoniae]|nr:DUF551 domain-containing protein [Klebsiella pneumoniae]AUD17267.1 hypothetical protein CXB26_10235 [Klebsiella pneumoniae]AUD28145.1 hypothetical protein CXB24_10260 [Klebsiella pneumoniae]AUD33693.1 hypothetical protein CXB25_10250 [Klebsiella pneumoniae]EKO6115269.1 DUF551 domain-containing protein [Klebsiella pneumoniae]EKV3232918.1 DUF551 domain-containing protein [Klebsiella pneumoniae]
MIPDKDLTDDVLDEIIAGAKTSMEQYLALSLKAEREVWRKEGPTDDEGIMAIEGIHSCERCGDEGWVVGEMGITRCACGHAGNSPAQSDCCPAQNHASPEQNGDTPAQSQGWIPVSERMPEDEQEVLTINRMGHRFVSFFDKHSGLFFDRLDAPAACCIEHVLVTHWMPLPAAPQEVKGES